VKGSEVKMKTIKVLGVIFLLGITVYFGNLEIKKVNTEQENRAKAEALVFETTTRAINRTNYDTFKVVAGPKGQVTWNTSQHPTNPSPNIYIVQVVITRQIESGKEEIRMQYHVNIRTEDINLGGVEIDGELASRDETREWLRGRLK